MENTKDKGIFARISDWFTVKGLLGFILLAFIIIIILMSASFIPSIMGRISSSLSAALYSVFVPAENATITTDKIIVNSGEDFTISFKKVDSTPGIFTISYVCDSNVTLASIENNGLRKIDCDKLFYLLENETSLKIRPTTADNVVRLVIEGAFENSDTQKSEKIGVARITIKNNSIGVVADQTVTTNTSASTPKVTANSPTYTTPAIQSTYYGKPDLAVRILQVGILNQYTNLITTQSQFTTNEMVGIKFEVRNDGDANTGIWSFTASLPSVSTPTYNSSTQISLRPGESIIFTLGFTNLTNLYTSLITINVDSQNLVTESSEYNNIATQSITNLGYNTNYNSNTTGCYVNGLFTYNCNNYYSYNGWSNNTNYSNGYYDSYGNYISYNNNNYTNGYYDSYGNFISYNSNNYNSNLGISCYGVVTRNNRNDMVVYWYSTPYGGNGVYSYSWSGSDSLDSTSQNPSAKTYYSGGTKYATVTVKSNNAYVSQTCNVYVN